MYEIKLNMKQSPQNQKILFITLINICGKSNEETCQRKYSLNLVSNYQKRTTKRYRTKTLLWVMLCYMGFMGFFMVNAIANVETLVHQKPGGRRPDSTHFCGHLFCLVFHLIKYFKFKKYLN